jgi:hypothetical protein
MFVVFGPRSEGSCGAELAEKPGIPGRGVVAGESCCECRLLFEPAVSYVFSVSRMFRE